MTGEFEAAPQSSLLEFSQDGTEEAGSTVSSSESCGWEVVNTPRHGGEEESEGSHPRASLRSLLPLEDQKEAENPLKVKFASSAKPS